MDNIKKIFAAVFAVMAVILMSTAVFAYSGSGAKSDPYVVYTFYDLKTCMEAGGHVKLGGNISRSSYGWFNIANNTVLDLDGYTLSLEDPDHTNTNYGVFHITGKLRIADSGGVIEVKSFTESAFKVKENAELIIDSGKIKIDPYYENSFSGIDIEEGGKFTLNNGSVKNFKSTAVRNKGTTVINGGTLSSSQQYGLYDRNGSVYINNGTVNGCYTICYNLIIYGGDIYNLLNDYNSFQNIKIYGGNIHKMNLGTSFKNDPISSFVPDNSTVKVGGATVDKNTKCSEFYDLSDVIEVSSSVSYIPKITIANNVTPYIGKALVYPQNPDTSLYTLTSSWHPIGSSNEVTSFESGKKYELKLNFTIKNNAYKFTESCYADFPSVSSALYTFSEANVTDNTCTLTYAFTPTEARPDITTQPQSYTYYLGESHTFYVSASNAQSYQWHILDENNNELTLDDISQQGWGKVETTAYANLTSLRIASVSMGLNGKKIYCTVTGSNGTATSNTALITVKPEAARITITQQPPETVYFDTNSAATVSLQATGGNLNLNYSWYYKTPDRTTFLLDEEFSESEWTGSYGFVGTTSNGLTDKYDGTEMYCLVWNSAGQAIESEHFILKKYQYDVDRNIAIRLPKVGETYKHYVSDVNSIVPAELVIDQDRFSISVKDKNGKYVKQESGYYSMEVDYVFKAGYKYEFCFYMYLPEYVSTNAIYQFYSKGLIVNGTENGAADSLDEDERSFFDFWTTPVLETDGDVNGNGVVNNADAAMLLKHISGGSTLGSAPLARGDVNSDTEFNMLDVIAILGKES